MLLKWDQGMPLQGILAWVHLNKKIIEKAVQFTHTNKKHRPKMHLTIQRKHISSHTAAAEEHHVGLM